MHGVSLNSAFEAMANSAAQIHSTLCSTAASCRTAVTVLKANERTHHPNVVNVHQLADTRLHRLQYMSIFVPVVFC